MPALTLKQLIDAEELKRGEKVKMTESSLSNSAVECIVEYVKPGFLILSFQTNDNNQSLLGKSMNIIIDSSRFYAELHLEVVQEQLLWPIRFIGLIPVKVIIEKKNDQLPVIKPDYIINAPYKVMGAKPMEEKGEGVILQFSPTTLVIGTDGFLSRGDFVNIAFMIPRTKQQISGMTRVIDKNFMDGSSVVTLAITDIAENHLEILKDYYNKIR